METPETPQQELFTKAFPKKKCQWCEKEFDVKKPGAKFCSDTCRGKAFRHANKKMSEDAAEEGTPAPKNHLVTSMAPLSPQAQYIIKHQQDTIDELKKRNERITDRLEVEQKAHQDLKDRIKQMELDAKLEAIQNAKPTGMQGFIQGLGSLPPEVVDKVTANIGPALGKVVDAIFGNSSAAPAGVSGQLDSETQTKIAQFNEWFSKLPKAAQDAVYGLLVKLGQSATEEELLNTITRILNLSSYGTNSVPFNPTGTFG